MWKTCMIQTIGLAKQKKISLKLLIYLKPLKTQLTQILFFPVHSKVIPFICVFTSFLNVQERFSKTWAWLRTSAKNFGKNGKFIKKNS